jgi:hypothetical protein
VNDPVDFVALRKHLEAGSPWLDPMTWEIVGAAEVEVQRLREIERVFNEGWLPPIPGEPGGLRGRSVQELRALIEPRMTRTER